MERLVFIIEDDKEQFKTALKRVLKKRFGVSIVKIQVLLLSQLNTEYGHDGRLHYNLTKYSKYTLITDFTPIGYEENIRQIPDITDIGYVAELVFGVLSVPKVWFTDDLEVTKEWIGRLPDTFAYDIESMGTHTDEEIAEAKEKLLTDPDNVKLIKIIRSNALMPPYNICTMHSFSIDNERSFVLISTPEIEKYVLDFLTTTEKQVIGHNMGFDMRYVFNRTGKFIKNFEDTQLIAQAYMNNVNQPQYGLKSLVSHINPNWGNEKGSFNLYEDSTGYVNENLKYKGSNPNIVKYNLPLIYYAGIDSQMTRILWYKFSEIDPEWEKVDIEDILPIPEPRDFEHTPRFFYENVLKPIVPTMIELTETPMPIDMSVIADIKQEALNKREPAMEKLKNFDAVKQYMQGVIENEVKKFVEPLVQKNAEEDANPKSYKNTMGHRTLVVNKILGTTNEKWSVKDLRKKIEELEGELDENSNT